MLLLSFLLSFCCETVAMSVSCPVPATVLSWVRAQHLEARQFFVFRVWTTHHPLPQLLMSPHVTIGFQSLLASTTFHLLPTGGVEVWGNLYFSLLPAPSISYLWEEWRCGATICFQHLPSPTCRTCRRSGGVGQGLNLHPCSLFVFFQ